MANTTTTTTANPDGHDDDLIEVKLPTGAPFWVYARERDWFDDKVERYLTECLFTNVGDLQDLDRVIAMELFCWRWGVWLSQQVDYWGDPIDEKDLSGYIKNTSTELRAIKASLGIDKVNRDKVKGEDSVNAYLENLRIRAREFGIMREEQLGKTLELFHELIGKVTLHQNCTDDERQELHCELEDIFRWITEEAIPEFNKVDEHFRETSQRFWIRDI